MDGASALAQWCEAVDASEQFLLAGLRHQIGPDGDLQAAYRQWYEEYRREHDRMFVRLAERLAQRGDDHGG